MAFITAAIGAGIGAIGSIGGAVVKGNAAGNAAAAQAAAAGKANDVEKSMYDQQRSDNQPWMQAGTGALSQMQDPSFQKGFTMADYQADPGYQFRLDQGNKALERSAAARGGLMSGGTLKGLTDYSQGMASQEYGNAYNRFTNDQNNRFGRLATVAGMGQTATGMNDQAAQHYGDAYSNNITGAGNAQAAGTLGAGNAWGSTLSGLGSGLGKSFTDAMAMNNQPNWLGSLGPQFGASAPGGAGAPQAPGLGLSSLGAAPNLKF